jgi:hypothetical protein
MHLYIVVDCKTQDCRTVHVLVRLGEKGKTPAKVEYWMSYPLIVDCSNCGKTYDHSHAEEQFRQKDLPPPPTGYFDRLALPPVPKQITFRIIRVSLSSLESAHNQP